LDIKAVDWTIDNDPPRKWGDLIMAYFFIGFFSGLVASAFIVLGITVCEMAKERREEQDRALWDRSLTDM